MNRKLTAILLTGAMLCFPGASWITAGASEGHSLTVYAWDPSFNIPALEAAALDYQTNVDPDFELNIVEQPGGGDIETLITNVASAGAGAYDQLPDITLFQDHYFEQYLRNYPDVWLDVNDAELEWENFAEEKLSFSTIDGVHYGIPVDGGTCIAAYRVDLLEEAGYTIEDMTGISWEEFEEIGEAVYEATGKYLLCFNADGNDLPYILLQEEGVSQFRDGEPYLTENETLREVVALIADMAKRNVLALSNSWDEYTNTQIQGDQVAGVINGNWIIPTIENVPENEGCWEITSLPTLGGEEGYASNGGASLYLTANCQDPDLAKDFLAYSFGGGSLEDTGLSITYDDALLNGGVVTTYLPAGESEVYSEGVAYFNDTPIYQKIAAMTSLVTPVEQSPYHYTERDLLGAAIINVINGGDLDSELENAEQQLRFAMNLD